MFGGVGCVERMKFGSCCISVVLLLTYTVCVLYHFFYLGCGTCGAHEIWVVYDQCVMADLCMADLYSLCSASFLLFRMLGMWGL